MQTIKLDADADVAAIRLWCVSSRVTAAIVPILYRNRIRHFEASMSDDDAFLFRMRWHEKTRPIAVIEPGPVDSGNEVPFSRSFEQPS